MEKTLRLVGGSLSTPKTTTFVWSHLLELARKALAQAIEIRVHPSHIQPMPGQPRVYFNQESILRLADSIRGVGQVYPGIVRKTGENIYELLDGERRWRAITLIGIPYRALLVDIDSDAVPFLIAAIANFNREAHTALEIADSIDHMYDKIGMPVEEVAKVLGITVPWAYQMLQLRHLHPEVREMMDPTLAKDKRLRVSAAIQISRMEHALQPPLARRVLSKDVSLSGLRTEVVRVSKQEGKPITTRTQEPSRRWRLIGNRMSHLRRFVGDLEDSINQPDLSKMIRTRMDGFGIEEAIQHMQDLQRLLARTELLLVKAKRKM